MSSSLVMSKQQVPRVKVLKPSEKELVEQLPIPPEFDYLKSPFAAHAAHPLLPCIPAGQNCSPLDSFYLFFEDPIHDLIITNTNRYAELKVLLFQQVRDTLEPDREKPIGLSRDEGGIGLWKERPWNAMSLGKLKVFIGLQILMGI